MYHHFKSPLPLTVLILHLTLTLLTLIHSFTEPYFILLPLIFILLISTLSFFKIIAKKKMLAYEPRTTNTLLILGSTLIKQTKNTREIIIDGVNYKTELCQTCNFYMTVNTIHCRKCNVCVINHDHHCYWIDNCIGDHNYKFFILEINLSFLLIGYNFLKSMGKSGCWLGWVYFMVMGMGVCVFGLLIGYFWILASLKISSRDFMKKKIGFRKYYLKMLGFGERKKEGRMIDVSREI